VLLHQVIYEFSPMTIKHLLAHLILNVAVALTIFLVIGLFSIQFSSGGHSMLSIWQFWVLVTAYPVLRSLFMLLKYLG